MTSNLVSRYDLTLAGRPGSSTSLLNLLSLGRRGRRLLFNKMLSLSLRCCHDDDAAANYDDDDGDDDADGDDPMLASQVTYPDFSYDCEALAVDPVTRYRIVPPGQKAILEGDVAPSVQNDDNG